MRRQTCAFGSGVLLSVVGLLLSASGVGAQSKVAVVNQPKVTVPEPVSHSKLLRLEKIPVAGGTADWMPAGKIDVSGFTYVMVSLGGVAQGYGADGGFLEVRLVPHEDFALQMLAETKIAPFALGTLSYPVGGNPEFFASEPVRLPLAFETYDVFFRTTSSRSIKVSLYLYLTH